MKLDAIEYKIMNMDSVTNGVADIIATNGRDTFQFQVITYTEKPVTLSVSIINEIELNNMTAAHQLASLFLSIYYLNKQQVDDFLKSKHEARKLSI